MHLWNEYVRAYIVIADFVVMNLHFPEHSGSFVRWFSYWFWNNLGGEFTGHRWIPLTKASDA